MDVFETEIDGVLLLQPDVFGDERGFFVETWQRDRYEALGIRNEFVQDNLSFSRKGVLRGLHAQHPRGQAKLVQVLTGKIFDVAVDLRAGSPTFGQWVGRTLTEENRHQLYIPDGFAHGFCTLCDSTLFSYKCSNLYSPENELTVLWNDADIGINWPIKDPVISEKDAQGKLLRNIIPEHLPQYGP